MTDYALGSLQRPFQGGFIAPGTRISRLGAGEGLEAAAVRYWADVTWCSSAHRQPITRVGWVEVGRMMTPDVQLAALAVIELTARQIVDPEQTELHRNELAVIMRNADPTMVALEIATILAGVITGTGFPIGELIEHQRARIVAASG